MMLYEWRVSLLDGTQSLRLSPQGIWIGDTQFPWSQLSDAKFARYSVRGGLNEEFTLVFGADTSRKFRWVGNARQRAAWREMLVAFAQMAARQRPDLSVNDGPDAQEQKTARWIGVGVVGLALAVMGGMLFTAQSFYGFLVGVWIGVTGCTVGTLIYAHYARREAPPRLDWASFAAREGQEGELPAN